MDGSGKQEYLQQANRDVFVTVQVETVELLAELDEVLKLEGLDSLVLGPQDLSGSMGRLGETTHPEVIAAMKTVASKARAAGKFIGSGLGANPEFARVLIDCGVQWLQAGNDFEYMIQGCQRTFDLIRAGTPLDRDAELAREDLPNDVAVDVGQAVVAAAVAIGQPLVVEAHQVQDRRVQVVDVDLVLRRRASRIRRWPRGRMPRRTPPPAIHIVKPNG